MSTLRPETIDALRAVSQAIAIDEGKSFDMRTYHCGTTLCIGGHLAILRGYTPALEAGNGWFLDAKGRLRGISNILPREVNYDDWLKLFIAECWPGELYNLYYSGRRVEAAQLAIEWFIAQHSEAPSPLPATASVEIEVACVA
jgi:hypothetical protein